ncbi:CaiB/BaiF CoA transferase family protein [Simiduia agarivorans]|uniref:CAIB/BAIF family protein n=1 Tax=Simiduia agarivorans (strain DSM 21679 / JCM 13881 / BCRC 17597 / SA1) TaxID=1117647 RepID=K4KR76_SIMAS|nr:CaiB/BaiF CoA-transferase family protein [Simiduia agarivorans]AFV00771.1 CAIB/BAIF family protein [Simiduia agarivorans SA1 = DSM 21679]
MTAKPLDGIRVIEMGQLIAGPFTGCILGYFGAEVIKIEPPEGGDPLRGWRALDDTGTSYWWRALARNKKSVTLDLRQQQGQALAGRLIEKADVLVENFRPGVMEKWGLGPAVFEQRNPALVYARISGFGQTGPYAHKPGFASVCEGMSGFRYVNGFPGEAPVRPNLSIGDTIAGLHAALGIALAILAKQGSGKGQVVDVALVESMFNLMEGVVPEYSGAGLVREAAGTTVTGIVPTNTYRCNNGKYVVIGGNGDSIYKRLMVAIGREDLANDPRMANNVGRVEHQVAIDNAIAGWCLAHSSDEVIHALEQERVPVGPIYSVQDQFNDPHFQARGLFEQVEIDGKPLEIPAILPRLANTPGETRWPGGAIGSHNKAVLGELLGLSETELAALAEAGVIASGAAS